MSSSDIMAQRLGSKPQKAASNPGHLASITFQRKPAMKMKRVMAASQRSAGVAAISSRVLGLCGSISASSASGPPFRSAARS